MARTLVLAALLAAGVGPAAASSHGTGHGRATCYQHVRSDAQRTLVTRESRGIPTARNRHSSARGCGQLLAVQRRHYNPPCGAGPNSLDPAVQVCAMGKYVDDRYGSDDAALAHSDKYGWY